MYKIRKETRPERDDIFSFFTTERGLNEEKTEIIDIDTIVKENVTKVMLLDEVSQLQSQIDELTNKQADINTMIAMIDNYIE